MMLSSSVMQTSLLCIPISGETVVIRHRPGALFGSSACKAPFDDASPAKPESAIKIENRRHEDSGVFIVILDSRHERLACILSLIDFTIVAVKGK
jgi:hypothetical protein